jgi:transcriptional regulator GlxA family with amidase domain
LQGDNFSYKVARELLIYLRRQGSAAQESVFMRYRNHIHAGVHSVQDYIQENIAAKITISQLADVAFMSSRNLTRIFKKEIGIPVNEYINLVRKEKIAELLKNPDITRAQIAKQCGLTSVRHLSRLIQSL